MRKIFYLLTISALLMTGCKKDNTSKNDWVEIKGVKWATRNLAAHGKFVEKPEDYGALFQWGRKGDGHEQRTSPSYPTNDGSIENGMVSGLQNFDTHGQIVNTHDAYGKFIKQRGEPFDWRSPQIDALWNSGSEKRPVKTTNDPCPAGWRVPTSTEFGSLSFSESYWGTLNGVAGRFWSNGEENLFLPAAGDRAFSTGVLYEVGTAGSYRVSTINDPWTYPLRFDSCGTYSYGGLNRADGFSVRCVVE